MTVASPSLINQTIGNYRVIGLLGEGGMGVVYWRSTRSSGARWPSSCCTQSSPGLRHRVAFFQRGARDTHDRAREHRRILDFGQTNDGQPYFIMEYLTGESLSEAVARGAMAPDHVTAIGVQMCRALGAAHSKGIVHRDLKPHNVQICTKSDGSLTDGSLLVKILDFGVAKILTSPTTPNR